MKMSQQADELLITRPRTSNCWYGVFFDLVSKSGKLKIHDIQSGCSSLAQDVELDLQVWKCTKGSFLGNENDPSAWKCLGKRKQVMNVIEFEQGEFTIKTELYKSFPLDEPIPLDDGETVGILLYTDSPFGLVLRGGFGPEGIKNAFDIGGVTDYTLDLEIRAGPPCSEKIFVAEQNAHARAFVGAIGYSKV